MYLMRFIPQSSIIVTIDLLLNLGCCFVRINYVMGERG